MDVDRGRSCFHRLEYAEVGVAVEGGVNAALQADLAGAAIPRLPCSLADLVEIEQIARPSQLAGPSLGECAEPAAIKTDVGVVDVAVDDVSHRLASKISSAIIGQGDDIL